MSAPALPATCSAASSSTCSSPTPSALPRRSSSTSSAPPTGARPGSWKRTPTTRPACSSGSSRIAGRSRAKSCARRWSISGSPSRAPRGTPCSPRIARRKSPSSGSGSTAAASSNSTRKDHLRCHPPHRWPTLPRVPGLAKCALAHEPPRGTGTRLWPRAGVWRGQADDGLSVHGAARRQRADAGCGAGRLRPVAGADPRGAPQRAAAPERQPGPAHCRRPPGRRERRPWTRLGRRLATLDPGGGLPHRPAGRDRVRPARLGRADGSRPYPDPAGGLATEAARLGPCGAAAARRVVLRPGRGRPGDRAGGWRGAAGILLADPRRRGVRRLPARPRHERRPRDGRARARPAPQLRSVSGGDQARSPVHRRAGAAARPRARLRLGGQGPLPAGREACEKLLAIDPSAFKAHLALAEIDLAQGDAKSAERRVSTALALQPEWAPAFERMGTALARQGRHGEAIAWFEKALAERKDDTDALQGLGVALAECGQLESAVQRWRAALACGVNTSHLHENLANALSLLGRKSQAREHRALSRRLQGKRRFGLDLLREAWDWLSGGTSPGR